MSSISQFVFLACILRNAAAACSSISSICVYIQGMPLDKDGHNLNGQWAWAGCFSGEPYYSSSSLSRFQLCYYPVTDDVIRWVISVDECGKTDASELVAIMRSTADLLASQNEWYVRMGQGYSSEDWDITKPIISECDESGKFEMGETADVGSTSTSYSSALAVAVLLAVMILSGLVFMWWKWRTMRMRSSKPRQITDDNDEEQTSTLEQIEDEHSDLDTEIEIEVELQMKTDGTPKAIYCG